MKYLQCPDLTENKVVSFYSNLNNKIFRFVFKWNDYCDCCFLDIFDNDGNEVKTGNALCANRLIKGDTRILPMFYFAHKDGLNLEPTPETMKDYRIYADIAE